MKLFNYKYVDDKSLIKFLENNLNLQSNSILVQVFTGILDIKIVKNVIEILYEKLPSAKIIGTSTGGEILDGKFTSDSITISFCSFEDTKLETFYFPVVNLKQGVIAAKEIIKDNTKAVIAFSESLKSDPENFFEGFDSINKKNVIVSGGNAGDNDKFIKTFIIKDNQVYEEGIVLCSLNSQNLIVNNKYTLNWKPIGKELTITKVKNNIVYEINNQPVLDIYKYYFGQEIEKNLLNSVVNFPLIKNEDGINVARALLSILDDNSFFYAGHFKVGDKVRFAVGNVDEVMSNANKFSNEVSKVPVEGIFIYSCIARRNFFKENINKEFSSLEQVAKTTGFLTYGEFFNTGKSNQVLTNTTTILTLSESNKIKELNKIYNEENVNMSLKCLTNLVNVTQNELENKINLLNELQTQLIESEKMASLGELVSGVSHELNTPIGIGLTGATHIEYLVEGLKENFEKDELTEEELTKYIKDTKKLAKTIKNSLQNAAQLVKSFKLISVDQHSNISRKFNLHNYLNDTILGLKSELRKKKVFVRNEIDEDIELDSYPGIYSQIFTNLILNSLKHAFENDENNYITLSGSFENKLIIEYSDNGKGINKGMEKKIFDPFYTTARGKGGSGLGLNIVYNLVRQKLNGDIKIVEDSYTNGDR